jgi:FixJ family two-component response regulator
LDETAIFAKRVEGQTFTFEVDNTREMGDSRRIVAQGLGVGSWYYAESAQDETDSARRAAPRVAAKETRIARLCELVEEHGESWKNEQYADELGVTLRTVERYRAEQFGESAN